MTDADIYATKARELCDRIGLDWHTGFYIAAALRQARDDGLEQAAKIANHRYQESRLHNLGSQAMAAQDIYDAIRAAKGGGR